MESDFIRWLRSQLGPHPMIPQGIGDDAAVLDLGGQQCVVTTDALTDGVDFQVGRDELRRIGHKSLAVSLSDLAAMAARPVAAFVSVVAPDSMSQRDLRELYEGMFALAESQAVAIAGGDTNTWEGGLVISTTLIGAVTPGGALLRSGAVPGDAILVTGACGGSILGRHLDVRPRCREMLTLREDYTLHAGIDISDGLSLDLSRLADQSGCGAVVELGAVPVHPDAERLAAQQPDAGTALDHALGDGEDFELILAVPPDEAERLLAEQPVKIPLTRIGQFIAEPGLWQTGRDGNQRPLQPKGFEHKLAP